MFKVPYFRHMLGDVELESVRQTFQTSFLTGGPRVAEFEREFSNFFGYRNELVSVNSCTNALHLSLVALGIGPGDKVITTPMSFVATSNAILYAGAEPVFADIDTQTGLIDLFSLSRLLPDPKVKAIIVVHLYGQMVDMEALRSVAGNIPIIEDSAHCIDGFRLGYNDAPAYYPGEKGELACFSFHALKTMTCGDGGAIITKNSDLAKKLRFLRAHGMSRSAVQRQEHFAPQEMVELGYKYNMSDIEAAILLPQIPKLVERRKARAKIYQFYADNLWRPELSPKGIIYNRVSRAAVSSHSQFVILVDSNQRDDFLAEIRQRGVEAIISYPVIHLMPYYRKRFGFRVGDYPNAEYFGASNIALPMYALLTREDQQFVVDTVLAVVSE